MEYAIAVLEDQITMLAGKMARVQDVNIPATAINTLIQGWKESIEELTKAQQLLNKHQ